MSKEISYKEREVQEAYVLDRIKTYAEEALGFDLGIGDAFELASHGRIHNLNLGRRTLNRTHPFVVYSESKYSAGLDQYVERTRSLLAETLGSWGKDINLENDQESALLSLVSYDIYLSCFETFEEILSILVSDHWEEGGKVNVPYKLSGRGEIGEYKINKELAARFLDFYSNDKRERFEAIKDPYSGVLYIVAGNLGDHLEPYLEETIAIIGMLRRGEKIGSEEARKFYWTDTKLPDDIREELGRCGCLILHPTIDYPVVQPLVDPSEAGVMVVPICDIPWVVDGWLDLAFVDITIPSLIHDLKHLEDLREHYRKAPHSNTLLEVRSICTELDYFERLGWAHDAFDYKRKALLPYVSILKGEPRITHTTEFHLGSIKIALSKLDHKHLVHLASVLE